MASVYLAVDEELDQRPVVVKIPKPAILGSPGNRSRFVREVRALVRQRHPAIVRVYDAGEHRGHPYLVVEYLEGGDLSDRLDRCGGRMTPGQVLEWLPAISEALDGVHRRGVVHRDVKPGNILFDADGHPFLSDFGIAAQIQPGSEDTTWDDQGRLTVLGSFVGSPAYAPPEAIERQLSGAYDQYSLAIVVYRALSGRLPFEGATAEAYLVAKSRDEPIPLANLAADVPPGCLAAVMRALSRDPAARFPSCRAFAAAFAEGLHGHAPASAPLSEAATVVEGGASYGSPRRGGLWRGVLFTAGLAALPLAGLAAWWILGARTGPEAAPGEAAAPSPWCLDAGSTPAEIEAALELCRSAVEGCRRDWYASEKLHHVCVQPFDLDRVEVRVADFARFANATGYVTAAEHEGFSYDGAFRVAGLSWRRPDGHTDAVSALARHPVVHVSAKDAAAYCAWAGGRLPTRDEWELAARGPDRRIFPWGDRWEPSRVAGGQAGGAGATAPVGSVPSGATPDGHLDLAGNVWEWTSSRDAHGRRVLKGGSFQESNPANLRAAVELMRPSDDTSADWGFRCARDRS